MGNIRGIMHRVATANDRFLLARPDLETALRNRKDFLRPEEVGFGNKFAVGGESNLIKLDQLLQIQWRASGCGTSYSLRKRACSSLANITRQILGLPVGSGKDSWDRCAGRRRCMRTATVGLVCLARSARAFLC